jgi:hypothetical protein
MSGRYRETAAASARGFARVAAQRGCGRGKAATASCIFNDYVMMVLNYLDSPMIESLRTLQNVSELPEIQKKPGNGKHTHP